MQSSASASPLLVVKIGGSAFSDKRLQRCFDATAMSAYAGAIAGLAREAPGRVVFVSGGGAFGHAAVRDLDPRDAHAALPLTEANFELKWRWTQCFRACGLPALPLQLSAFCAREEDGSLHIQTRTLQRLLSCGILPVLSGDVIVGRSGELETLGSDRVPSLLLTLGEGPVRVVALTDVPGLLTARDGSGEVVREVDADDLSAVVRLLWAPPSWDTSSSMAGKIDALAACARKGAECFILEADSSRPLGFLTEPLERWPPALHYTRITRFREGGATASTG